MALHQPTTPPDWPQRREKWQDAVFGAVFILLLSSPAGAQGLTGEIRNEQWGLTFTVPEGWIGQQGESGYVFGSETLQGLIMLMPHEYNSLDELRAEAEKGLHRFDDSDRC